MQTSDVLNRAADLIEERGWAIGNGWVVAPGGEPAPLCLEGGIQAALGITMLDPYRGCPAYLAVKDYLGGQAPWIWNDGIGRTASGVIETLRACAVIEASRERQPVEVSA